MYLSICLFLFLHFLWIKRVHFLNANGSRKDTWQWLADRARDWSSREPLLPGVSVHLVQSYFLSVVIRDCAMHPDTSLIGKHLLDFLLIIIKLFRWVLRLKCYDRISTGSRCFCRFFTRKMSRRRGRPPPTICARLDGQVNALQHCRWQFSHKKLYRR